MASGTQKGASRCTTVWRALECPGRLAQSGSPFDTGFTSLQSLFTRTIAKVANLIAIVIGSDEFAHGEPSAKKDGYLGAIGESD